jgi:hypothetical protein
MAAGPILLLVSQSLLSPLRRRVLTHGAALLAATGLALAAAATANADGPYEPNESPGQAFGPLTSEAVAAALETPQDVDWYRFYTLPQRQIGVLATLSGACPSAYGNIRVLVLDADVPYSTPLGTLTLGKDWTSSNSSPITAARIAFTSQAGHRYFLKVTQTSCQNTPYTLQLAPAQDLTRTLQPVFACTDATRTARLARWRLYALTSAERHAHGARRRQLRARAALQRQTVITTQAAAGAACTRPEPAGYPFN